MRYILIGLLLVSVAVFAQESGTVILSSDNEADLTAAEAAAENVNASVVSSPWGEDTNSTLESIAAKNPKEIIIIGGPVAIPASFEQKLNGRYKGLNVSVIRVYGKDRYETAAAIVSQFWGNTSDAIIVQGDDIREMRQRLLEAKNSKIPVLFIKSDGVPEYVKLKLKMWKLDKARMYLSPDANESAIERDLNETEIRNVTKLKEKLAERALEALDDAKSAIADAEAVINVTNESNSTTIAASRLLALAQNEYAAANASYENGSYGHAFGQAISAQAHARFAVKVYNSILAGDLESRLEKVKADVRERGMAKVIETARNERDKANKGFRENRTKAMRAVVRAGRQNSAGQPGEPNAAQGWANRT